MSQTNEKKCEWCTMYAPGNGMCARAKIKEEDAGGKMADAPFMPLLSPYVCTLYADVITPRNKRK